MFEIVDENCAIWYMKIYCNTVIGCHTLSNAICLGRSTHCHTLFVWEDQHAVNALLHTICFLQGTGLESGVKELPYATHCHTLLVLDDQCSVIALSYTICLGLPMRVIHYLSETVNALSTRCYTLSVTTKALSMRWKCTRTCQFARYIWIMELNKLPLCEDADSSTAVSHVNDASCGADDCCKFMLLIFSIV